MLAKEVEDNAIGQGLVTGRDFSRADKANKINGL
jgi:hypothetical protein